MQQPTQQAALLPSLKALAAAALARNSPSNNDATTTEGARNNDSDSVGSSLHGIRTRLLVLAASEGLHASVVDTITADELHLYAELDDADLLLPLHLRARCSLCGGKDPLHDYREHDHAEA